MIKFCVQWGVILKKTRTFPSPSECQRTTQFGRPLSDHSPWWILQIFHALLVPLISLPHFPTDLFHTFFHCKTLCCRFRTLVFRGIPLMDCGKKTQSNGCVWLYGAHKTNGNSTEKPWWSASGFRGIWCSKSILVSTIPYKHQPIGVDRSHWPLLISWSCLGVWRRLKMFVDSPLGRLWKIEWNWKSTNNINLEKKSGTLHFPNIFLQPSNCPCADLCPCRRDGLLWGSAVMGNSCPRGRFLCWRYMLHVASYIGNVY